MAGIDKALQCKALPCLKLRSGVLAFQHHKQPVAKIHEAVNIGRSDVPEPKAAEIAQLLGELPIANDAAFSH